MNHVILDEKEAELVSGAVMAYVGKARDFLPLENRTWSVLAGLTRKLENRKKYHTGYDSDFELELQLLEALMRSREVDQFEKDIFIPAYSGKDCFV